jgi:hypothetical protein
VDGPTINAERVHEAFWSQAHQPSEWPVLVDRVHSATQRLLAESGRCHSRAADSGKA